jgi:nucleoside-diphosphate-sugar epimerase
MKILVTGATGFLGAEIVRELLHRGASVRALVRKTSNTSALESANVALVVGSLNPPQGLKEALSDVDAVIHCAGGGWAKNTQSFYDNNTLTTENLLAATEQHNPRIQRFVLVSSLAAHGPCPDGVVRDPESEPSPLTHYGKAKVLAEKAALKRKHLFPVTIIRPPAIYGPADTRLLPLFKVVSKGIAILPAAGRSLSMIHVSDCARAVCDLALKSHPNGRRYFVEDGRIMSHETMARTVGAAVGRTPRILRIPRWVFWIAAVLTELTCKLLGREALLTRDKVTDLSQSHWICDASPLRQELGWEARLDFETGAAQTANWYRRQGWLK